MKPLALCLLLLLPITALASQEIPAVLDDETLYESCDDFSQAGMRECMQEKAEASQEALWDARWGFRY